MSRVRHLARAYGRGEVTATEVIVAARAGDAAAPSYTPADTFDEMARRVETDESASYNTDGWDGVTSVYLADGLTDVQYAELHALYVNR